MSSMSYCHHENTAHDLAIVVQSWNEGDSQSMSLYEVQGRRRILENAMSLVRAAVAAGVISEDLSEVLPEAEHATLDIDEDY